MKKPDQGGNNLLKYFIRLLLPSLIVFFVFMVMIFGFLTPYIEKRHFQYKEELCRYLVEVVTGYLESVNEDIEKKLENEEEAKKRALERIRGLRFGKQTKDYFWILDARGVVLMHPFRRDMENIDPELITGPDGEILMKLMIKMSDIANSSPDGGSIRYVWNRRDEINKVDNKIAYLKKFQPWGWIIGTGVYIDEAEREIRTWKIIFISVSILLALFSAVVSLILSLRAHSSRKKEELARERLFESERNLRIREELFRSIFEKSPHGIVITDINSDFIINANSAFAGITGYRIEELIGKVAYTDINPFMSSEYEKFMGNINLYGVVENINSHLINSKKIRREIIYSAILINYMDKECILRMIVDVTEGKLLEEKLRQSQKMDVIGRLAGGIAHDFNNMLGVIMGSAELLLIKLKPGENEKKYIMRILDTGEKASGLVRKLMLFSRKSGAVFRDFDIHDTLMNVVDILEHTIDRRIVTEVDLKAENSMINGDQALIENSILNMGLNSRDAMPQGGRLCFSTRNLYLDREFLKDKQLTADPGYYIEIEISDTGHGIPPELLERIFEPFFTTKPAGKGTGLGLAAVYGTVKEHRGTIDVCSSEGMGAVFRVYLPCVRETESAAASDEKGMVHGNANILIIDDDRNILENLGDMLTELGYNVRSASGGIEGVSIFAGCYDSTDIVITDMIMSDISGIETIERLKKIKPDIRIIVSSGFNNEEMSDRISEMEISGFIQKPFRIDELSRLLNSLSI